MTSSITAGAMPASGIGHVNRKQTVEGASPARPRSRHNCFLVAWMERRPYVPFPAEATHPRCDCEGCPDRPGRASMQGGRVVGDHSEAFVAFDTSKLRNAVAIAEAWRGAVSRRDRQHSERDGQAGEEACGQIRPVVVLLRGRADRVWALPAD